MFLLPGAGPGRGEECMGELGDLVGQLRLYGVDVLWSATLEVPGVWSQRHRFMVLSPAADHGDLVELCREVLDEARPPLAA